MDELLTVRQVAEKLKLHPATVYAWLSSGYLEAIKLPSGSLRIEAQQLTKLLRKRGREARAKSGK